MPESCNCPGCNGPNRFTSREAENDLRRYRKEGATGATKALIDALKAEGVDGARVLDIGGGVGAITLDLLEAGASIAESVDATEAYVVAAREEAARRGLAERTSWKVGDFVSLAPVVVPADVVTLDKVICCYPDLRALLGSAAQHSTRLVGLIYPRERWWNWIGARVIDFWGFVTRNPLPWFQHSNADVDAVMRDAGFERHDVGRTLIWQVVLFTRTRPA